MTLQNAGITRLIDRIVNLIGSELYPEEVLREPVVSEPVVSEPVFTMMKRMKNAWSPIRVPGSGTTIQSGDYLTVQISDDGDYLASLDGWKIKEGVMLDCRDGSGANVANGGRASAEVFSRHNYVSYTITITQDGVHIAGRDGVLNTQTMKWSCTTKRV